MVSRPPRASLASYRRRPPMCLASGFFTTYLNRRLCLLPNRCLSSPPVEGDLCPIPSIFVASALHAPCPSPSSPSAVVEASSRPC